MRACKLLTAFGLAWFALGLVFPDVLPDAPFPLAVLVVDLALVCLAVNDLRTRHVPNFVTYSLMAAGVARAVLLHDPAFVIYWVVLWFLWGTSIFGGGDAKVLMGLFGLFPDMRMTWLVSLSIFATGIPYLAFKHRRVLTNPGEWRKVVHAIGWRVLTRQLLPSQQRLDEEGVPFVFAFSLAGAVYLFLRGWPS